MTDITNYIIIYVVYALFVWILAVFNSRYILKKRQTIILLGLLIIGNSLIASYRPIIGTPDTSIYALAFQNSPYLIRQVKSLALADIFANRNIYSIEIGFILMMSLFRRISDSTTLFFFIVALVTNILYMVGIYMCSIVASNISDQEGKDKLIKTRILFVYSFFVLFDGILYTSVAIRAGLSIGMALCAIGFLLNGKNRIISVLFFLVSILIHTTSLAFVLIYILIKFVPVKLNKRQVKALIICSIAGYFLNASKYTISALVNLIQNLLDLLRINAFSSYISDFYFVVQKREGYILVAIGLILYFFFQDEEYTSKRV